MLRSMSLEREGRELRLGPLKLQIDDLLTRVDGRVVILTKHESELLAALMRHGEQVVRREELYTEVWGGKMRQRDRSVDVYVFKLRTKLERALPGWAFIHTHTGWGYRLSPEWRGVTEPEVTPSSSGGAPRRQRDSRSSRRGRRPSDHLQGSHS